jgi:glycosyltransferase involved in cell wall biosynthesis
LNKGVQTVFEAFLRLAPRLPRLSLTIAGSGDDELTDEFRERAAQASVADRLELLGFVEHSALPDLYRSSDIVAVPSKYEGGLGMVYLEAMASGLPAVATAAGGAAEAIVDGETGILLASGSEDEVTAAIERLATDPSLRRRMGDAGRLRAEQRFSVASYAERVAAAYGRAIDRRRASLVTW